MRVVKSGIAKKSDSSEGISERRASAVWWFNGRAKISIERTGRSYACGVCNSAFSMEKYLMRHEREEHDKALAYYNPWPEGTAQIP